MATSDPFDIQLDVQPLAAQINLKDDPSVWSMAVLIPLSLYICSNYNIGLAPVLITRLLVIVCMNFVQKEAVGSFPGWFLLAYQMVLQVVLIGVYNYKNMTCGKWTDLLRWIVIMVPAWILQLITSIYAFKAASVSTIQIIRSVLPLVSFAMEKMMYNNPKVVKPSLIGSMVMVLIGTALYSHSSTLVTGMALVWIFLNSIFTVVATVLRSKFMKDKNFTVSLPLSQVSVSTVSVPCICLCAYISGETETWSTALATVTPTAWFWLTMSGLVAGCFSFLQFRCQKIISGTSDLMFQNFVKVFIIIMGMVAFGDSFNLESSSACCIAIGGCMLYGYLRIDEAGVKEAPAEAPASGLKVPLIDSASGAPSSKVDGAEALVACADTEKQSQTTERENDKV